MSIMGGGEWTTFPQQDNDNDNPFVVSPLVSRRTTGAATTTTKGILHPHPKYPSTITTTMKRRTPSRSSNDDSHHNHNHNHNKEDRIPDVYVDTIIQGFGENVDLHRDVLQISPVADARVLRISYFRRGRSILAESSSSSSSSQGGRRRTDWGTVNNNVVDPLLSTLSDDAKTKFQAVSMAYDILSTPTWNDQYRREGLVRRSSSPMNSVNSPTASTCAVWGDEFSQRPPQRQRTVHWNEQVEELVYEPEPRDPSMMEGTPMKKKKKRTRPQKTKVLIDPEDDDELDDHLAKLDAEAEAHFAHDLFDTIEESLDGLLRLTGNNKRRDLLRIDGGDGVDKDEDDNEHDDDEEYSDDDEENSLTEEPTPSGFPTSRGQDEESLVGYLASHLQRFRTAPTTTTTTTVEPSMVPLSHTEATDPFRCISPEPTRTVSPTNEELLDAAPVNNPTQRGDKILGLDDVFDGIEDEHMKQPSSITLRMRRSSSPSNLSTVSDLSESVATTRSQSKTSTNNNSRSSAFVLTPRGGGGGGGESNVEDRASMASLSHSVSESLAREIFDEAPEDEFLLETNNHDDWFQIGNLAKAFSFGGGKNQESSMTTTTAIVTPEKTTTTAVVVGGDTFSSSPPQEDGFVGALTTFLQDMARECSAVGKSLAEVCTLDDADVEQMMRIVTQEVTRTPLGDSHGSITDAPHGDDDGWIAARPIVPLE